MPGLVWVGNQAALLWHRTAVGHLTPVLETNRTLFPSHMSNMPVDGNLTRPSSSLFPSNVSNVSVDGKLTKPSSSLFPSHVSNMSVDGNLTRPSSVKAVCKLIIFPST